MNNVKYFLQFILIIFFFLIFKILGIKISSFLGGKLFQKIGPIFRSKKITESNIKRVFPDIDKKRKKEIISSMWNNYGRVFAEYMFIKNFRNSQLNRNIVIEGNEILERIKNSNEKVIFISGHFSNFELMAMHIEKVGIKLAAIYRPLNNYFLNFVMERIRKKYICRNQIKKGIGGLKELIRLQKDGYSTALMIDQRVTEGIKSNFFNEKAFTTTIPAQIAKKFKIPIVPIFISRYENLKFKITISQPIKFSDDKSINDITEDLNRVIEKMILKDPNKWIWTHNRWK